MNKFDENLPYAYSFGSKGQCELEKFRMKMIGGIANVYHRHINLQDDQGPYYSRYSRTNEKFTHFAFYDFNAMYCHAERLTMPLTPGVLWKTNGRHFEKSLLLSIIIFTHISLSNTSGWTPRIIYDLKFFKY